MLCSNFHGLEVMIIDLESISRSPRHFDLTFEPDWWKEEGTKVQIQGLEGPFSASVHVKRDGEQFVMSGCLRGKLRLVCDRCMDIYTSALSRDFKLSLSLLAHLGPMQEETELRTEDLAIEFVATGSIDLDDIIREQIFLSLPMKLVCEKDCAGLCAGCGVNLNHETCKCSGNTGHSAFSKLKELQMV